MIRSVALLAVLLCGAATAGPRKDPPKKDPAPAPPPAPAPAAVDNQWPRPAGSKQRIVGILDVKVEGVPPDIAAQFQQILETQVDTKHYWLAPRSRMHELMANSTKWTEGCIVGTCLREVRAQTNAELVLLVALTGSGTSFGYVVTLVRTDTGRVLAQEQERCDVCTVNEALSAATLATVKILNAVPQRLPDEPFVTGTMVRAATEPLEDQITSLESAKHHAKVLGVALTLVGIVAAAAGATVYYTQDHTTTGIVAAAAGGGLALGGVVSLAF